MIDLYIMSGPFQCVSAASTAEGGFGVEAAFTYSTPSEYIISIVKKLMTDILTLVYTYYPALWCMWAIKQETFSTSNVAYLFLDGQHSSKCTSAFLILHRTISAPTYYDTISKHGLALNHPCR